MSKWVLGKTPTFYIYLALGLNKLKEQKSPPSQSRWDVMVHFMKKLITTAFFLFLFVSCEEKQKNDLYLNYVVAINNESTFQYHLVVKFKNANTGEIREICAEGNFLKGALHREYSIDYDEIGVKKVAELALKNKERYFEFKNDGAIANMGVKNYSMNELEKLEKKVNFDSIVNQIKKHKKWAVSLEDKEIMMYAHALFNRGILTGENNCMGGTLVYVDGKSPLK